MKKNVEESPEKKDGKNKLQDLSTFVQDANLERKKVVWPDWKSEVIPTSIAVLVFVAILGIFLGVWDLILSKIVAGILS